MTDRGMYQPTIEETFPGLFSTGAWNTEPPVNFRRLRELINAQAIGTVIVQCGEEQYDYQVSADGQRNALVLSQPRLGPSGGKIFPADRIIFY